MGKRSSRKQRNADEKARIAFSDTAAGDLLDLVRKYQATGYDMFIEFLTGEIETDGGRITYTNKNLSKVQRLITAFQGWGNKFKRYILKPILESARKLFGLNEDYFKAITTVKDSLTDQARKEALKLWGYDVDKDEVLPGGYLDGVFASNPITGRIAALMNQAIANRMKLSDFQKAFRRVFVGKPGFGMLEQHWKRATYDLYQKLDRISNLVMADRLKLNYAIYSGTVIDTTRQFCEERVNKVFSRKQIDGWSELSWSGKPAVYNPYIDCGGYNCRHHLSFVSDEVAEVLLQNQK